MFEGGLLRTLLGQQLPERDSFSSKRIKQITEEKMAKTLIKQKTVSLLINSEESVVDSPARHKNVGKSHKEILMREVVEISQQMDRSTKKEEIETKNVGKTTNHANMKPLHTEENSATLTWNICIQRMDTKTAEYLVHSEQLPDSKELMAICEVFGRKSEIVHNVCKKICAKLSKCFSGVKKIFPALKSLYGKDVIFVVLTDSINVLDNCEYNVEFVFCDSGSDSPPPEKQAHEKLTEYFFIKDEEDANKYDKAMADCISAIPDSFFEMHRHVTSVSPSYFRSKNRGNITQKENCIVIGVLCKDYIPIDEDELPTHFGQFPTDIRENFVQLYSGGLPYAFHQDIKIGCLISGASGNAGAIGCFLEHSDYPDETYALTAAHLFFDIRKWTGISHGLNLWKQGQKEVRYCYQPNIESGTCGELKYALYNDRADIAIFKIDKSRNPKSKDFPDFETSLASEEEIKSIAGASHTGKSLTETETRIGMEVYKIGPGTLLTKGVITSLSSVCVVERHVFRNMIEVFPKADHRRFGGIGDSGSLVFTLDKTELIAVGIILGGTSGDGRTFVTPMATILSTLAEEGINMHLKAFDKEGDWATCLRDKDEKQMKKLLQMKHIPKPADLNTAYTYFDKSSSLLADIFGSVSEYIRNQSADILFVYAAFDDRKDSDSKGEFRFIAFTKLPKSAQVDCGTEYPVEIVHIEDCSKEDEEVVTKELQEFDQKIYTDQEENKLEQCISEHAERLMKETQNITLVTTSGYKSTGYQCGKPLNVVPQPCVAVIVMHKGWIPIGSKPLPPTLNDITVDVREGIAFPFMGTPTDMHQKVRAGCKIESDVFRRTDLALVYNDGTLGGFLICEKTLEIYGFTCAHCLFSNTLLEELLKKDHMYVYVGKDFNENEEGKRSLDEISTEQINAYQTSCEYEEHLGTVEMAMYTRGSSGESTGIDFALIKINKERIPDTTEFPVVEMIKRVGGETERVSGVQEFHFHSGNVITEELKSKEKVLKYGCKTLLTEGICKRNSCMIRLLKDDTDDQRKECKNEVEEWYGQCEIKALPGFAESGDSGSLVLKQNEGDLEAACILVGGTGCRFAATSILEIFRRIRDLRFLTLNDLS